VFHKDYNKRVMVTDIEKSSLCEHQPEPFTKKKYVA
jgi:GTP cyclohydrolase I